MYVKGNDFQENVKNFFYSYTFIQPQINAQDQIFELYYMHFVLVMYINKTSQRIVFYVRV